MAHRTRVLLFFGMVSAALTAAAGFADGSRPERLLVPWLAAHLLYLAAVWLVLARSARLSTWLIVAVALVPRLILLPLEPRLSEDLYRYLWDGRLVAAGMNPFHHAPDDPALARYHDALLAHLNHANVPTIYPPTAQLLFGAAARVAVQPWAWKTILLALEVILFLALRAILTARRLPRERLLFYAWNPLVIVESFGNGHVDLGAAAFLLLSLASIERGRPRVAGVALGAAALVKYMPLLAVPALLRRREYGLLCMAAATMVVLYLPFVSAGPALITGLTTYLRHWDFNGSLYALIRPWFHSGDLPRWILAGFLIGTMFAIAWRARTVSGAIMATLAAWLIASPTVYPWYLVMIAALLPLHPDRGLLVFSGLVSLSYVAVAVVRATGTWALPVAIPWIEYGGWGLVAAATGFEAWRRYRRETAWAMESPAT